MADQFFDVFLNLWPELLVVAHEELEEVTYEPGVEGHFL